jgi:hypothetical protein
MSASEVVRGFWHRVEALYDARRVWCLWCQDAPATRELSGFCGPHCRSAYARFEWAREDEPFIE